MVAGMSTVIAAVELSFGLLMLMQMQSCHGQTGLPEPEPGTEPSASPELLQLDNILTDRINTVLKRYEQVKNATNPSQELLELYERLEKAAAMPMSQLDQKILVYNEYLAYEQDLQKDSSRQYDDIGYEDDLSSDYSEEDQRRARAANSAFEERVFRILKRRGNYDAFTERVFQAIFSDEKQLGYLKEKLNALDDDGDEGDFCIWDFIFGLF